MLKNKKELNRRKLNIAQHLKNTQNATVWKDKMTF